MSTDFAAADTDVADGELDTFTGSELLVHGISDVLMDSRFDDVAGSQEERLAK